MNLKHFSRTLFVLAMTFAVSSAWAQNHIPSAAPTASENAPLSTTASQESPELTAALEGALDLFRKTDFNGAHERLKQICANEPKLAPPRLILASWFARANLGDAIRINIDRATIETPNDPEAYILLGEISLRRRELTAATLLFERGAQKLQPYNANPERAKQLWSSLLRNLTALAEMQEEWPRMEQMIDQRIAREGKSAALLRQKAVAMFRQNKDAESHRVLMEADQLDAKEEQKGLPADAILSQLYVQRGDTERAKKFLADALQKNPRSKEVLTLSVFMRLSEDDLRGARQLAEQLLREDTNSPQAKQLLGSIALFQEDYQTAERLFQEITIASPTDSQAVNGLALALCEQNDEGKLKRAVEYAVTNVQRDNKSGDFLGTLGWILMKSKDMAQAGKVLQEAAARGNLSPQTAFYLAQFMSDNGNKEQAKQMVDAALQGKRPFAKKQHALRLQAELSKE